MKENSRRSRGAKDLSTSSARGGPNPGGEGGLSTAIKAIANETKKERKVIRRCKRKSPDRKNKGYITTKKN